MFSSRHNAKVHAQEQGPQPDLRLRDEADPDPLVEQMVDRLRAGLGSLAATDEFGRQLAWRNVVRLAVGPSLPCLRDAETAALLWDAVTEHEPPAAEPVSVSTPADASSSVTTLTDGHGLGWPARSRLG